MQKDQPSRTARKVALNIVTLGSKPVAREALPSGIVDATARLLVDSGAVSRSAVRFSRSRAAVAVYMAFDWLMPGQFEAFAHRKAFCERQVRKGIRSGARQVLVLGAGYDTLGWRLAPQFAGVSFFEIDHPATAHLKAKGIERMGRRENLHLISKDLGEHQLARVLQESNRWDRTAPSVFVAEGLLMYLPPQAVGALFRQCSAMTGVGGRIAFSYVGTRPDGLPDAGPCTKLILRLLKASGEPWLWSTRRKELASFLKENAWTLAPNEIQSREKYGVEFFGVAVR